MTSGNAALLDHRIFTFQSRQNLEGIAVTSLRSPPTTLGKVKVRTEDVIGGEFSRPLQTPATDNFAGQSHDLVILTTSPKGPSSFQSPPADYGETFLDGNICGRLPAQENESHSITVNNYPQGPNFLLTKNGGSAPWPKPYLGFELTCQIPDNWQTSYIKEEREREQQPKILSHFSVPPEQGNNFLPAECYEDNLIDPPRPRGAGSVALALSELEFMWEEFSAALNFSLGPAYEPLQKTSEKLHQLPAPLLAAPAANCPDHTLGSSTTTPAQQVVQVPTTIGREGPLVNLTEMEMPMDGLNLIKPKMDGPDEGYSRRQRVAIICHPLFPRLVSAYCDCQKVGASAENLEKIDEDEKKFLSLRSSITAVELTLGESATWPALDLFMGNFIETLTRFRNALELPLKRTLEFCESFETRLLQLSEELASVCCQCGGGDSQDQGLEILGNPNPPLQVADLLNPSPLPCRKPSRDPSAGADAASPRSPEPAPSPPTACSNIFFAQSPGATKARLFSRSPSSARGWSLDPAAEEGDLRAQLKRKYRKYFGTLQQEVLKKRKKGKLPPPATLALQHWWTAHLAWPYPSEQQKAALAAETGLNSKQINNWFINQRKRHWSDSSTPRKAKAVELDLLCTNPSL